MNSYTIHYDDKVIHKDLPKLSHPVKKLIKKAIDEKLTRNPHQFGKPLRHSYKGHRRLRVSDYRVIYRIDEEKKNVFVVAIGHRKDIYDA